MYTDTKSVRFLRDANQVKYPLCLDIDFIQILYVICNVCISCSCCLFFKLIFFEKISTECIFYKLVSADNDDGKEVEKHSGFRADCL